MIKTLENLNKFVESEYTKCQTISQELKNFPLPMFIKTVFMRNVERSSQNK